MISDSLKNSGTYADVHRGIGAALRWLRETDLTALESERVDIDGDRIFALVQGFETVPVEGRRYEAHRRYADIQCVVRGTERMLVKPAASLTPADPYDEEKDLIFFRTDSPAAGAASTPGSTLILGPDEFAVFFPQDAHMPMLQADGPEQVLKIVVKVEL